MSLRRGEERRGEERRGEGKFINFLFYYI